MNNGAFGEHFPYTNFHDLNLDWIIKTFRKVADDLEHFDETSQEALAQIAQEVEDASTAITDLVRIGTNTINTATENGVDQITSLITDFSVNHRVIFITDSYGGRVDSAGRNLMQLVKLNLNLSDDDYRSSYVPGAAFAHSSESGRFITQLQAITITDPDSVTEIVVSCGANDANYYTPDTTTAIAQFYQYAKLHYKRAKVIIVGAGLTFTTMGLYIKQRATEAFVNSTRFGCIYPQGCEYVLMNSYYLESDRVHPNQYGVPVLARAITEAITSAGCTTRYMKTFGTSTDPAEQVNPVLTLTNPNPSNFVLMDDWDLSNAKMSLIDGAFNLLMSNYRPLLTCRFNITQRTFDATNNLLKVELTNTLIPGKIIVSGSVNSPNGLGLIVDNDDQTNTCPCIISFTYDEDANKYYMTFKPIRPITLTNNKIAIYGSVSAHM